jgi:hypothetical protein
VGGVGTTNDQWPMTNAKSQVTRVDTNDQGQMTNALTGDIKSVFFIM